MAEADTGRKRQLAQMISENRAGVSSGLFRSVYGTIFMLPEGSAIIENIASRVDFPTFIHNLTQVGIAPAVGFFVGLAVIDNGIQKFIDNNAELTANLTEKARLETEEYRARYSL